MPTEAQTRGMPVIACVPMPSSQTLKPINHAVIDRVRSTSVDRSLWAGSDRGPATDRRLCLY